MQDTPYTHDWTGRPSACACASTADVGFLFSRSVSIRTAASAASCAKCVGDPGLEGSRMPLYPFLTSDSWSGWMFCKNLRWQFSTTLQDTVGASTGKDNSSTSSAVGLKKSFGGRHPGKCSAVAELETPEGVEACSEEVVVGACCSSAATVSAEGSLTSRSCLSGTWCAGSRLNAWMTPSYRPMHIGTSGL